MLLKLSQINSLKFQINEVLLTVLPAWNATFFASIVLAVSLAATFWGGSTARLPKSDCLLFKRSPSIDPSILPLSCIEFAPKELFCSIIRVPSPRSDIICLPGRSATVSRNSIDCLSIWMSLAGDVTNSPTTSSTSSASEEDAIDVINARNEVHRDVRMLFLNMDDND
jgi:hypothetical protein